MHRLLLFFLSFMSVVCSCWVDTSGATGLKVVEGVVTTGIADRMPVDAIQSYPSTVEKLYFFTELAGVTGETTVTHVWYFEDKEMNRSVLPVRNERWRTWSVRAIRREWAGKWRVEVLDAEANPLLKIPFVLTRP